MAFDHRVFSAGVHAIFGRGYCATLAPDYFTNDQLDDYSRSACSKSQEEAPLQAAPAIAESAHARPYL
jgi:hypothetical protein